MKKIGIAFMLLIIICFEGFVSASCESGQIDINSASLLDLDRIIYVGPVTAQNIVNTRPFFILDDLLNVSGIGDIKLQAIKYEGIACVGNYEEQEDEEELEQEEIRDNEDEDREPEEKEAPVLFTPLLEKQEPLVGNMINLAPAVLHD